MNDRQSSMINSSMTRKMTRKIAIFALTTFCSILPFNATHSATFEETEVEQSSFIAVAQPYGDNKYNLIVIEQIPDKNICWSEVGTTPVNVDILLLNFDFSGHCRRSTDANGYSIRYDGQDFGLDYILNLVNKDGNLVLQGVNRRDPRQEPITVGIAQAFNNQPVKIELNPGWRFTKRTYQGKVLGHVYFSYDSAQGQMAMPMEETGDSMSDNLEAIEQRTMEMMEQGTMQDIVAPAANP